MTIPHSLPRDLSVLVATPHAQIAAVLAAMLRGLGIRDVGEAGDSDAARRLLETRTFGAMILDDAIGPRTGIDLTRAMRMAEQCPNRALAVIMISGLPEKRRIEAARDAGIHEFLRLPVSAEILRQRLAGLIAHPRPFVSAPAYAGPDRRRRTKDHTGPDRRRGAAAQG